MDEPHPPPGQESETPSQPSPSGLAARLGTKNLLRLQLNRRAAAGFAVGTVSFVASVAAIADFVRSDDALVDSKGVPSWCWRATATTSPQEAKAPPDSCGDRSGKPNGVGGACIRQFQQHRMHSAHNAYDIPSVSPPTVGIFLPLFRIPAVHYSHWQQQQLQRSDQVLH